MPAPIRLSRPTLRESARFLGFLVLLFCIVTLSGWAGYVYGHNGRLPSGAPAWIVNALNPKAVTNGKEVDFAPFWQAWNLIDQKFNGNADPQKRLDGAIAGMVGGLKDPYTLYFEPDADKIFRSDLQGSFGGIGAELSYPGGLLTVDGTIDGTPSYQAGLRAGDVILKIGDKKSAEFTFAQAILAIRGEVGTTVELQVARSGQEQPLDFKIVRNTITVKSVKTESVGVNGSIAYIRVNQFADGTDAEFKAALTQAKNDGKKGLLIDLRNNPGGFVDTATKMIGMVIPKNPTGADKLKSRTVLLERYKDGVENTRTTDQAPILDILPMVVLVNGGSASASEIFSGAMKDYARAKIVGSKTYGKGSEQELQQLDNGGSIKVTIAKWFTPLGTGIDGKGLEPDVSVDQPAADNLSSSDTQATKALELLK
jgi:carboxyl-terminal processing protease